MSDTTPTCGIAGCTGSHYPQDQTDWNSAALSWWVAGSEATEGDEAMSGLCSACGKREGENHDLPGRCSAFMVEVSKSELAALRAENQQLRDECLRLAPLWADYSEDVTVEGVAVVRCHPEDSDKVRDHVAALRLEIQKLAADVLSLEAELEEVRMFKQQRESDCETFGKVVDALRAERDRYRAALEQIEQDALKHHNSDWTEHVTRTALNGGDDE